VYTKTSHTHTNLNVNKTEVAKLSQFLYGSPKMTAKIGANSIYPFTVQTYSRRI